MILQPQSKIKQESSDSEIEVLEMVNFAGTEATVKASCSVRIGHIVINGVKVIVPKLCAWPFVGMPAAKAGGVSVAAVQFLDSTLEKEVSAAVLDAWEASR